MKRSLIFVFGLLVGQVCTAGVELGANLVENGNFEEKVDGWQVDEPANWVQNEGIDRSGALFMNAPYYIRDPYIYEKTASRCLPIENADLFEVKAQFRYDSLPIKKHGHRLNLVWYEDAECIRGGQFGTYLEPTITDGWQQLTKASVRPALNAVSVKIILAQNQKSSAKAPRWFENLRNKILNIFGIESSPTLASAYWDDLVLIPTKIAESTKHDPEMLSLYTLPIGHNYIKNGSFAEDGEHWRLSTQNEWSNEEGYQQVGALRSTLKSTTGSMGTGVFRQCVNFGAIRTYQMSVRFKRDPQSTQDGSGRFRPTWYEEENCQGRSTTSGKHADPKPGAGWQELKVLDLIPPKGARSVVVSMIQSINGTGEFSVYWDDVRFMAISN